MAPFFQKKMNLPIGLIHELLALDWFSSCGTQENPQFILVSKEQALRNISSKEWECIVLAYRGMVTEALSTRECLGRGKEYRCWNDLTQKFRQKYAERFRNLWDNRLRSNGLDANDFLDALRFAVTALVVVYAYGKIVEIPPFFSQMLDAVRAGHYPCGYDQEIGKMLVY